MITSKKSINPDTQISQERERGEKMDELIRELLKPEGKGVR